MLLNNEKNIIFLRVKDNLLLFLNFKKYYINFVTQKVIYNFLYKPKILLSNNPLFYCLLISVWYVFRNN